MSNHPNWNTPSSSTFTPQTYGVITSAKTMRQLQFALKYSSRGWRRAARCGAGRGRSGVQVFSTGRFVRITS
jgi:hypothetical protein